MTLCSGHYLKTGKPCRNKAVRAGVCRLHGADSPQVIKKAERDAALAELHSLWLPEVDDAEAEANPATALHEERKRTLGRIRFLERRLAETVGPDELAWGKTKTEHVEATEFPGTNVTWEARPPVLYDLLLKERQHYVQLIKIESAAQFKAAELALQARLQQQSGQYILDHINAIVRALGHNPHSAEVQDTIRDVLTTAITSRQAIEQGR